jgi:hypothetical protein
MKPEDSLSYIQESVTGPSPGQDESGPNSHTVFP